MSSKNRPRIFDSFKIAGMKRKFFLGKQIQKANLELDANSKFEISIFGEWTTTSTSKDNDRVINSNGIHPHL